MEKPGKNNFNFYLQLKTNNMALNAYLTLKGQKQGTIHGSVTQKGREGSIAVIAIEHEIVSPRDAGSENRSPR